MANVIIHNFFVLFPSSPLSSEYFCSIYLSLFFFIGHSILSCACLAIICLLFFQCVFLDGFVPVSSLLSLPQFRSFSLGDIERVVSCNDKQRFMMRSSEPGGKLEIRANQGHSLQVLTNNNGFGCRLKGSFFPKWCFCYSCKVLVLVPYGPHASSSWYVVHTICYLFSPITACDVKNRCASLQ